jgi:DNA repair protein RadC
MMERLYTFDDPISEAELIRTAKNAIAEKLTELPLFDSPQTVRDFLTLEFADLEIEIFYVLFLTSQHQLIEKAPLFQGTIDGAAVYPREIVRAVIKHNAAAVILAHNHPSGNAEPSTAYRRITERVTSALALIDVRVLDHLVVGGNDIFSFAEQGLL